MAFFPSLSLWSSIKIPFSLYGNKKTAPTVPYVDSCKDLKLRNYNTKAEPAREMVNLTVPAVLCLKEESSNSSPQLRAPSITHKKTTHRRSPIRSKTKQIGYVVVPNGAFFDRSDNWEETFSNNREKSIANSRSSRETSGGDDLYHQCPRFDFEGVCRQCDHIPSVKAWEQEELDEIKRKYKLLEHKRVNKHEKLKKQKENSSTCGKKTDKASENLNEKESEVFQVPFCEDLYKNFNKELRKLITKMKGTSPDADYYERKLAELYLIELGLKIK